MDTDASKLPKILAGPLGGPIRALVEALCGMVDEGTAGELRRVFDLAP